jgi:hypothetical protein
MLVRRILTAAVLPIIFLSGCSKTSGSTELTRAECVVRASDASDSLSAVARMSKTTNPSSSYAVQNLLREGREAVAQGRSLVRDCQILGDTSTVEANLDTVDRTMALLDALS